MVWSSTHYIPVETTVKDYILLSDLHEKFSHPEILFLSRIKHQMREQEGLAIGSLL